MGDDKDSRKNSRLISGEALDLFSFRTFGCAINQDDFAVDGIDAELTEESKVHCVRVMGVDCREYFELNSKWSW